MDRRKETHLNAVTAPSFSIDPRLVTYGGVMLAVLAAVLVTAVFNEAEPASTSSGEAGAPEKPVSDGETDGKEENKEGKSETPGLQGFIERLDKIFNKDEK
ncbi:MAG: hypothetical protein AAB439_00080 [Patescibacteria group bacterium]